jgi:AcrR family transcriptional regulator
MASVKSTTRTRKSAEERREEIVAIAIEQFALNGYKGTSTEAIAREAGISQPYLFRLFKTKRDLFLACFDVTHQRIVDTFESAAHGTPKDEVLAAMGAGYMQLLEDPIGRLFQMQTYAACSDPVIQARVRDCYGGLVKSVGRLSGATPAEVWRFFANGMLLNITASLDLPAIADKEEWARQWTSPSSLIQDQS